ncbi:hypothetical protein AGMMS4956_14350 [Bacteroidia bacterium]|nr:hypothetical protein AGMMS4956_14350 [Bacteroidia bacterium]
MKQVYVKAALMGAMVAGIAIHSCKEEEKQPQTPPPAWAQDSIACGTKQHPDTLYVWNAAQHKCIATYTAPGVNQDSIDCVNNPATEWVNGECKPIAPSVNQDSIDCGEKQHADTLYTWDVAQQKCVATYIATPPAQATVIGNAANTCPADTVILTASATGATSYQWYKDDAIINGETASTYVVTATGTYSAAGVNADGEGTKSAGKTVTITGCVPPAQATIIGNTVNACPADTVILTASATGAATYKWYKDDAIINGETASTYVVTATGTYTAAGVNVNGEGTKSAGKAVTITQCLSEGFSVDATTIGNYATVDGTSGTITNTDGSNYKVRSINGTWWMIQNADKALSSGCTNPSIDRTAIDGVNYGHFYSWNCAASACPSGWSVPDDADFTALSTWLTTNSRWSEWNSGIALAGAGFNGNYYGQQGATGCWWSSDTNSTVYAGETTGSFWYVSKNATTGGLSAGRSSMSYSVRCIKK